MKDSFVFYRSFYESIKCLDEEVQLEIYNAICEYSLNDVEVELSPIANAIFTLIKPNVDNANARYKASVENGKKGGRPRKNENLEKPNQNLEKPRHNLEKPRHNLDITQPKPNNNLEKPSNNLDITYTKPNQNLNVYVYDNVYVDVDDNVDVDVNEDKDVYIDQKEKNIYTLPSDDNEILKKEFNKLWMMYPKKVGKERAFTKYKDCRTSQTDYCTYEEVLGGLERYLKYIKENSWYSAKDGSTWFINKGWQDEYELKEDNVPIWFNQNVEKKEDLEGQRELEELLKGYK